MHEGDAPDLLSTELDFLAIANDEGRLKRLKRWVFEFIEKVKNNSELYGVCACELETEERCPARRTTSRTYPLVGSLIDPVMSSIGKTP